MNQKNRFAVLFAALLCGTICGFVMLAASASAAEGEKTQNESDSSKKKKIGKPADFRIDTVHTQVFFSIDHLGFSRPIGRFRVNSGKFHLDQKNIGNSKLEVEIDIASLDLGDANWNKKMLDGTFFDVEKFPIASFVSERVEAINDNQFRIYGNLKMHGVSKPLSLDAKLNRVARHQFTFKKTAGFSVSGSLLRSEFNMGKYVPAIGDEVRLVIEAEGIKE